LGTKQPLIELVMLRTLSAFLLFAGLSFGQFIPGRYIVELSQPVADKTASGMARARAAQFPMRSRVAAYGGQVRDTLASAANALIVDMPEASLDDIAALPGVKRVMPVRRAHFAMDVAPSALEAETAWRNFGGSDKAGAGIKIGIIDSGINEKHAAFQDPSLAAPAGYPKADRPEHLAFTTNKVIVARSYVDLYSSSAADQTPTDYAGHGTAVAMAAAGVIHTSPRGQVSGMAPKAFLGNYRASGPGDAEYFDGDVVLKAFDDAVADGMDVINLSLGSVLAVRPEDDVFTDMVNAAAARGVIVVVAAGNEGPDAMTVGDYAQAPLAISVGASRHARIIASSVIVGGLTLTALAGSNTSTTLPDLTAPVVDVAKLDLTGLACTPLPAGQLARSIALIQRGTCLFADKIQNAVAAGAIGTIIYTATPADDPFSFGQGTATAPSMMVGNGDGLQLKALAAASSVTATMHFPTSAARINHRKLISFTSIGPGTSFAIKPEVVTIGSEVYTADPNGGYATLSGTSLASPIVAGAAAFLKGARPGLTVAQYRSLIINSAQWMDERLQQRGNGSLNLDQAANSTIAASPATVSFGISGVNANAPRKLDVTNLGRATETYAITVFPLTPGPAPTVSTAQLTLEPGQSASLDVLFRAQGLPGGERNGLLIVRGNASGSQIYVPYWHGVPTNVPSKISLLYQDDSAARSTVAYLYFRLLDADGLPVVGGPAPDVQPTAASAAAGASLVRVRNFNTVSPGVWEAQVRMRASSGSSSYTIQAAGAPDQAVTIPVAP
jgi:minor extracellular serine protease Vpr